MGIVHTVADLSRRILSDVWLALSWGDRVGSIACGGWAQRKEQMLRILKVVSAK